MSGSISSGAVKVFPLSKNRVVDRSSRLFYEDNITNLVSQLSDASSFFVTPNLQEIVNKEFSADGYFEVEYSSTTNSYNLSFCGDHKVVFNLGGYRFELGDGTRTNYPLVHVGSSSDGNSLFDSKTLYAYICVDKTSKEISGHDFNGKYEGLHFTVDPGEIQDAVNTGSFDAVYSIPLIKFNLTEAIDGNIVIEEDNVKFVSDSFIRITSESLDLSIDIIDGTREITVG